VRHPHTSFPTRRPPQSFISPQHRSRVTRIENTVVSRTSRRLDRGRVILAPGLRRRRPDAKNLSRLPRGSNRRPRAPPAHLKSKIEFTFRLRFERRRHPSPTSAGPVPRAPVYHEQPTGRRAPGLFRVSFSSGRFKSRTDEEQTDFANLLMPSDSFANCMD